MHELGLEMLTPVAVRFLCSLRHQALLYASCLASVGHPAWLINGMNGERRTT